MKYCIQVIHIIFTNPVSEGSVWEHFDPGFGLAFTSINSVIYRNINRIGTDHGPPAHSIVNRMFLSKTGKPQRIAAHRILP